VINFSNMDWLLLVLGCAVVTLASRLLPSLVLGKRKLPGKVQAWLALVPSAVLAAAVAPALFMPAGRLDFTFSNSYVVAAIPTLIAAMSSSNLLLPVAVGMLTLSVLRFLA
jgi:branched-subunit amino acid transport protein